MKKIILSFLACLAVTAQAAEIAGPDGRLKVNVDISGGLPSYSVTYDGKT